MSSSQGSSSNRTRGRGIFSNELVNSDSDANNTTTPRPRPLSGGMRRATISIGESINYDGLSQTTPEGYGGAIERRLNNTDAITPSSNDQTNPNPSSLGPPFPVPLRQMAEFSLQNDSPWSTTYLGAGGSASTAQSLVPTPASSFNNTAPGMGGSSSNATQTFIPGQQVPTPLSNDQTNAYPSSAVPQFSVQPRQMAGLSLQHLLPWSNTYLGRGRSANTAQSLGTAPQSGFNNIGPSVGRSTNTAQSLVPHPLGSFNNPNPGVGSSSSNATQALNPNQQVFIPNQQVFVPNQHILTPNQQVAPYGPNRLREPNHAALMRYQRRHHDHRRRTGHGRWRIDGVQIAGRHVQRREADYMPWASIDSGRRRHSWSVNPHYPYTHGRNHPNPDLGVGYPWKKDWEHVVTNDVMDGVDCPHVDNFHRRSDLTALLGVRGMTDQPGYSFNWWEDGLWEPPDKEVDTDDENENANGGVGENENQTQNENAGVDENENQNQNENDNENGSGMDVPIAEGEEADGHANEDINME